MYILILHSVLDTKMGLAPMENNIKRTKHIRARRHRSEGLPNDKSEISTVTKFIANVAKKKPSLDLQLLEQNRPSVVLLQSRLCSRGRTCLSAGICLV